MISIAYIYRNFYILKKYTGLNKVFVVTICYANNKLDTDAKDKINARIGKDYKITLEDLNQYVTYWRLRQTYRDDKSQAYIKLHWMQ
jgi:hypothetical protein